MNASVSGILPTEEPVTVRLSAPAVDATTKTGGRSHIIPALDARILTRQ